MARPSKRTWPALGASKPVMTLNSVVLPAPLGPMRPVIRPASAPSDTSSTARLPPNRTTMLSTSSSAIQIHLAQTQRDVHRAHVVVGVRTRDADPLECELVAVGRLVVRQPLPCPAEELADRYRRDERDERGEERRPVVDAVGRAQHDDRRERDAEEREGDLRRPHRREAVADLRD